jgi:hypothetical protein
MSSRHIGMDDNNVDTTTTPITAAADALSMTITHHLHLEVLPHLPRQGWQ